METKAAAHWRSPALTGAHWRSDAEAVTAQSGGEAKVARPVVVEEIGAVGRRIGGKLKRNMGL